MRIAQLSPLWERVPPPAYGGTEAVVHLLTEGLAWRGHEVTLFASGDSTSSATLRAVCPRSLRTARGLQDTAPYEWLHASHALESASEFDIIHNHAGELAMAMSDLITTPMLTTMHCIITPDTKIVWDNYGGYYNTLSWAERRAMPLILNQRFMGPVYNSIDVGSFPFSANKQNHLLYLSRIAPEKGTHVAIEVARRLGMKLIIAGKVDRVDRRYFEDQVQPLIDGKQIRFVGEANGRRKRELYRKASCVLLPILWDEPFGLVMPEALACGTPVVAFDRGAASEIMLDGVTGYLVHDADEMVAAVKKIDRIDPLRCRRHVEQHFDVPRMVDDYLRLYERILAFSPPVMHNRDAFSATS